MPGKRIAANFKYLLLLFLVFSSCRKNNFIIPEDKFVDILVDLHLADAIALHNEPQYTGFVLDSAGLYSALFTEHGVSKAQFDSTIRYLGSHPAEFLVIYDKVIARLQILNDEMMNTPETGAGDYTDLVWQDSKVYAFPEMGRDRVEVNIPIRTTGEYTVEVTMKLYNDDESRNPKISLWFWYDDNSSDGYREPFPEVSVKKNDEQTTYTVTKSLENSNVTHIRGYLFDYANRNEDFLQHALITEVTVYHKPL